MVIYVVFQFNFSGGEVPVTKLAALQKVLQSDFLNSVREVYEHVYETVDVQVSHYFKKLFHIYTIAKLLHG